ncbi:MAG: TetR/AcrR family transcriptional regulator [Acidimicrobiales bacterium]
MPLIVDHDAKRREIVDATWTLIATEGFEAASMRRIAKHVGATTGQITHYFESKDAILLSVLTDANQAGIDRFRADLVAAKGDNVAIADAIVESLPLDDVRLREWRAWLAFWGRAATSTALASQHQRSYVTWRRLLAETFARASERHPDDDMVTLAAEHTMAVIDGLGMHLILEPDVHDRASLNGIIHRQVSATLQSLQQ